MKFGTLVLFLLMTQSSFAALKNDLITRITKMENYLSEGRIAFEKQNRYEGCVNLDVATDILWEHINSLQKNSKIIPHSHLLENQSQTHYKYLDRQNYLCREGIPGDDLNVEEVPKKLLSIEKELDAQKKIIIKSHF